MPACETRADAALRFVREAGLARAKDLTDQGIAVVYLRRLVTRGLLVQPARGVYRLTEHEVSPHHQLATVSRLVPHGVVCLLSALHFHDLLTKAPHETWIAVDRKARRPRLNGVKVFAIQVSETSLRTGVEQYSIEGVSVPITDPAKSVVDAIRFREKVGIEVAVEALERLLKRKNVDRGQLLAYSRVCHVESYMQRYLEVLG